MKTKIIRSFMALIVAIVLTIGAWPVMNVYAAASSSISVSGATEVNSVITVNIVISGPDGPYSGFSGGFVYDSSFLRLDSISQGNITTQTFSSSIATGYFAAGNGTISSDATLISAKFTCLTAGSTTISLLDFEVDGSYSSASKSITITTPVPKSSNADLASLQISPGTLSPAFSASTQSYKATVGQDKSKITVSATAADSKAKVTLNGVQNNLSAGTNNVKITVTAENGATKVYTISVTRTSGPTPTPTPTSAPLPLMTYMGVDYMIVPAGSTDVIPDGFAAGTATYQGVPIPVLQRTFGETMLTIVLLITDTGSKYFVYDPVTQTVYPYQVITLNTLNFYILGESLTSSVPVGYEAFDYTYLDTVIRAYRPVSDPENVQILLNMMDANGVLSFYYYDTITGMILPYRGEVSIVSVSLTPTVPVTPDPVTQGPQQIVPTPVTSTVAGALTFKSLLDYRNPVVLVVYLLTLFCLVMLVMTIVMILRRSFPYQDDLFNEEPDIDPVPYPTIRPMPPILPILQRQPDPSEYPNAPFNTAQPSAPPSAPPDAPTPNDAVPTNVAPSSAPSSSAAPNPPVFYNEFVQPDKEPIVYADKAISEANKPVLDFPEISRRKAADASPVTTSPERIPVRLRMKMEMDPDIDPDDHNE